MKNIKLKTDIDFYQLYIDLDDQQYSANICVNLVFVYHKKMSLVIKYISKCRPFTVLRSHNIFLHVCVAYLPFLK